MKKAKGHHHKRTHLGAGPRTSKREPKAITAQPPARGRPFAAPVDQGGGYTRLEEAPGCSRTYTPPEED